MQQIFLQYEHLNLKILYEEKIKSFIGIFLFLFGIVLMYTKCCIPVLYGLYKVFSCIIVGSNSVFCKVRGRNILTVQQVVICIPEISTKIQGVTFQRYRYLEVMQIQIIMFMSSNTFTKYINYIHLDDTPTLYIPNANCFSSLSFILKKCRMDL